MSSLFARGSKLYGKIRAVDGKWQQIATGFPVGREADAERFLAELERKVAAQTAGVGQGTTSAITVAAYAETWIAERQKLDLDWTADRSRLKHHILPILGPLPLRDVRTKHLIELFKALRTKAEPPAQRTIYNIYSVASALFRDAKLADLIEQSPCCLDERQLGPLRDKNPEWRADAVFTRDEVETIISSAAIALDRRIVYGLELLAGVRCGEAAALRWRHYEPDVLPLGRLHVALAYNTRKNRAKGTKTEVTKYIPVHPTLATMLAAWRATGWAAMMGRAPEPDDLIVPLPPEAVARRRTRTGDAFRGYDYSGKRWREADLPALGWRHRRHYDMRATFITLALDDGADAHIIETRVTHTRKSRSAFDGYNRGTQWALTCAEVAKLKIELKKTAPEALGAALVQSPESSMIPDPKWWRRWESNPRPKMHLIELLRV